MHSLDKDKGQDFSDMRYTVGSLVSQILKKSRPDKTKPPLEKTPKSGLQFFGWDFCHKSACLFTKDLQHLKTLILNYWNREKENLITKKP